MEVGVANASSNAEYVYSCVRRVCDGCGASLAFTPMPAFLHSGDGAQFEMLGMDTGSDTGSDTGNESGSETEAESEPEPEPGDEVLTSSQDQDEDEDEDEDQAEDPDANAVGCPQPLQQALRWYTCAQCPEMDFCEACQGQHEHPCAAGRCHDQVMRCVNCSEDLAPWYPFVFSQNA
jgi:hypothetical protein